jgi:hypothetical protein
MANIGTLIDDFTGGTLNATLWTTSYTAENGVAITHGPTMLGTAAKIDNTLGSPSGFLSLSTYDITNSILYCHVDLSSVVTNGNYHVALSSSSGVNEGILVNPASGHLFSLHNGTLTSQGTIPVTDVYFRFAFSGTTCTLAYSTDSGVTWVTIATSTATMTLTAVSLEFNQTSTGVGSGFASVNSVGIVPPTPPLAPVLNSILTYNATTAATGSWTFEGANFGDTQSAYQVEISNNTTGATAINTGKVTSAVSNYTIAASALTNDVTWKWRVTTWSQANIQGATSAWATFNTATPPVAAIVIPTGTVGSPTSSVSNTQAVTWSYFQAGGSAQVSYDVQMINVGTSAVIDDSGVIASALTSYTFTDVPSGITVAFKVTVVAANGGSSTSVLGGYLSSSFASPPAPLVSSDSDLGVGVGGVVLGQGYIGIVFQNPAPGGSQPDAAYNEIWRRTNYDLSGSGLIDESVDQVEDYDPEHLVRNNTISASGSTWYRVATLIGGTAAGYANGQKYLFVDLTAEAGINYTYLIRAVSVTGYTNTSLAIPVGAGGDTWLGCWLAPVAQTPKYWWLAKVGSGSTSWPLLTPQSDLSGASVRDSASAYLGPFPYADQHLDPIGRFGFRFLYVQYGASEDDAIEQALTNYAGRPYPLNEYGITRSRVLAVQIQIPVGQGSTDYYARAKSLLRQMSRGGTWRYRDGRGRKIYGAISNYKIDTAAEGWMFSFTITQTTYDESAV